MIVHPAVEFGLARWAHAPGDVPVEVGLRHPLFAGDAYAEGAGIEPCESTLEVFDPHVAPERNERFDALAGFEDGSGGVRCELEVV